MGVSVFPSGGGASGSSIKSIQRGVASSAGNITISEINTAKTMVRSFSTGSSGTVAATGAIGSQAISANMAGTNMTLQPLSAVGGSPAITVNIGWAGYATQTGNAAVGLYYRNSADSPATPAGPTGGNSAIIPGPAAVWPISAAGIPGNIGPTNITGGTTNLTVSEFGIYIVNSTTIYATGACRWEVIEFN